MGRFSRPAGAITDAKELRLGDHVWKVIGIWPPFVYGEHIVTREAVPFKDHPEYADIHHHSASSIVFDCRRVEGSYSDFAFASDGNLQPSHSSNDNYWFRSFSEAEAAREFLHQEYVNNPDVIQAEVDRRHHFLHDNYAA